MSSTLICMPTSKANPGGNRVFLVKNARSQRTAIAVPRKELCLSIENRRTKTVYAVVQQLVRDGRSSFLPGDVNSALRERGQPMGTWEVRSELSALEAARLIELDPESGRWSLTQTKSKKATG